MREPMVMSFLFNSVIVSSNRGCEVKYLSVTVFKHMRVGGRIKPANFQGIIVR